MKYCLLLSCLLIFCANLPAQSLLQPGFDKAEYIEMMRVSYRQVDSSNYYKVTAPQEFRMVYRSPVVGLDNRWDLWTSASRKVAVISVRGSTRNTISWMENFYSAMLPAKGYILLSPKDTFHYQLTDYPKAAVHAGWLTGMAYLSKTVLPQIDSCYKKGIKDIIIMGHSQGGAIATLLTSYLYELQKNKELPVDIRFKTYASAAPKVGNLPFAYNYENQTRNGWAFTVVNTADWVPEGPISIQTKNDFNTTNPFQDAKFLIRKQKFPQKWVMKYLYNQLANPLEKAQSRHQKYLGKMLYKRIKKNLAESPQPTYYKSSNFVRAGIPIILMPDAAYYQRFPDQKDKIFLHHLFEPYMYLIEKY